MFQSPFEDSALSHRVSRFLSHVGLLRRFQSPFEDSALSHLQVLTQAAAHLHYGFNPLSRIRLFRTSIFMPHQSTAPSCGFQSPFEDSALSHWAVLTSGCTFRRLVSIPFRGFGSFAHDMQRRQVEAWALVSIPFRGFGSFARAHNLADLVPAVEKTGFNPLSRIRLFRTGW